ncbi:MAG: peptidylprolyl isomerase, partial [Rhizobacter sp.]|nr:peptidylprolyl isomerase [Rhizobacter sp.]
KVEEALAGKEEGFEVKLHLEPDVAFGDYDPALVFFADKSKFPEGLDVGMQFDGPPEGVDIEGLDPEALYTVTEVYPAHVVLDGNHPLAGLALRLDLKVIEVREATATEIEERSVSEPLISVMNTLPNTRTLH